MYQGTWYPRTERRSKKHDVSRIAVGVVVVSTALKTKASVRDTPIFTAGFEPLARVTLYLTGQKYFRWISWRSVAYHSIADSYRKKNKTARRLKTAKKQVGHSREWPRGTSKRAPKNTPLLWDGSPSAVFFLRWRCGYTPRWVMCATALSRVNNEGAPQSLPRGARMILKD